MVLVLSLDTSVMRAFHYRQNSVSHLKCLGYPCEIAIFIGLTWSDTSHFVWFKLTFTFVANGIRTAPFIVGRKYMKIDLLLF